MAKDILRFHGVIWPAMLMSAGIEVPRRLAVHGYVLKGGERMSKTTGNVVDPNPFIERYGIDALRYYLAREIRFGEDGTFTAEGFEARYSRELANELGNLLNRVTSMVERYRDGAVPADPGGDGELAGEVEGTVATVVAHVDALDLTRALEEAWGLVRRLNQLVEERAPWTLAKDPARGRASSTRCWSAWPRACAPSRSWSGPTSPGRPSASWLGWASPRTRSRSSAPAGAPASRSARVASGAPLFPRVEEVAA